MRPFFFSQSLHESSKIEQKQGTKAQEMSSVQYLQFVAANQRFIAFGFLAAFASSFGQTYFIGTFGPTIELEFGLSHTQWGTYYLYGTLASALLLPWTGKRIDSVSLRRYTLATVIALAAGALLLSIATNAILLVLAIFLLRQSGQGLMSHISSTSMARYFDEGRGRAIALSSLGFAAGEACLPILAYLAIGTLGWRWTFVCVAATLILVIFPLMNWLLSGHNKRHEEHLTKLSAQSSTDTPRSWTYQEVLRDPRFYLLLPGVLAPALIVTALFFTHLGLAQDKGWSGTWITGSYVIYAATTTVVALFCGPIIDRIGSVRLVPLMLLPMALALVIIGALRQPWAVVPYFIALGCSIGVAQTAVSAMWAELYGVESLGSIKSLVTSLIVLSSALGPVIMGVMRDSGNSIETTCFYFAGYLCVATLLLIVALQGQIRSSRRQCD